MNNLPDSFISTDRGDSEVVTKLNTVFKHAFETNSSDVHIEDHNSGGIIRIRTGGTLSIFMETDKIEIQKMKDKIRARALLAASNTTETLDSRSYLVFNGNRVDLRISVMPTIHGHSIVCRLLDQRNAGRKLEDLYLTNEVRDCIQSLIKQPNGLFIVTGPTGSGKTTTLYSILGALNSIGRKIVTIEDPVEYILPNVQQVNIDQHNDFSSALRASLRQDPDVILVGEIRDTETAKIAIQAAMTGHLVLSTLHTNNALASITRLLDLSVDPTVLGTCLRAVLAQRLLPRFSNQHFIAPALPEEIEWLTSHRLKEFTNKEFGIFDETDNPKKGVVPVMELVMIDQAMREAITHNAQMRFEACAEKQTQYETLARAGARLASEGITSLHEVILISGDSEMEPLIGERLIRNGAITKHQLTQALALQSKNESHERIGSILIKQGYCTQEHINEAIQ